MSFFVRNRARAASATKSLSRKIGASLLGAAMLLGAGLLVAPPAQAATCWYGSCDERDPQTTGCSADAYDIGWVHSGTMNYAIRWSPSCQAAWVRATRYEVSTRNAGAWNMTLRTYTSSMQELWHVSFVYSSGCNNDFCWSPMIPMSTSMLISASVPGYYNTKP
jgi:hypothetical protein